MRNVLKLSGEKAIGSFRERVRLSRLTLTFFYVIILAFILILSSGITRALFSERIVERFHPISNHGRAVLEIEYFDFDDSDIREDLQHTLFIVNSILLIIAGVLSYFLAGITLKPIQAAYEKQQKFLSDASHELRTPLSILQADLENELLSNQNTPANTKIQSHLEEVQRMTHLVNDLLFFSPLYEKDHRELHTESVNITALVNQVVQRMKALAQKNKVQLFLNPQNNQPLIIQADAELLLHALSNLIKNAIVYNQENGSVTVSLAEEKNRAVIQILDTGIGMKKEHLEKVFERFYRVDKSRSRKTGGSGLGLAIVQSALEILNGTISIESEEGKGTTITVSLPIHKTS